MKKCQTLAELAESLGVNHTTIERSDAITAEARGLVGARNGRRCATLGFVHFEFQRILALRILSRSY